MKCVKCGNEMRETNLYCSCCGARRTENSDIEDTQRIYVGEIVKENRRRVLSVKIAEK